MGIKVGTGDGRQLALIARDASDWLTCQTAINMPQITNPSQKVEKEASIDILRASSHIPSFINGPPDATQLRHRRVIMDWLIIEFSLSLSPTHKIVSVTRLVKLECLIIVHVLNQHCCLSLIQLPFTWSFYISVFISYRSNSAAGGSYK